MDEMLKEAVKQVPAMAVLVFVVLQFLSHIRSMNETAKATAEKHSESLKTLGDTCHGFQVNMMSRFDELTKTTNKVILDASVALGRAAAIMDGEDHHGRSKP